MKTVNIKGKEFVPYETALDEAHKNGLKSIEILDSWVSEDMKSAWCKVRATFVRVIGEKDKQKFFEQNLHMPREEMFFDGFGSSTPANNDGFTKDNPIEMANTRAKSRALRDFLNIGNALLEEIKQGNQTSNPQSDIVIPKENI